MTNEKEEPAYTPIPIKKNCGEGKGATHWMGCDCHEERHRKELAKKNEMLKVAEEALERHEHIERDGCRECDALEKIKQMREGCLTVSQQGKNNHVLSHKPSNYLRKYEQIQ